MRIQHSKTSGGGGSIVPARHSRPAQKVRRATKAANVSVPPSTSLEASPSSEPTATDLRGLHKRPLKVSLSAEEQLALDERKLRRQAIRVRHEAARQHEERSIQAGTMARWSLPRPNPELRACPAPAERLTQASASPCAVRWDAVRR
ncbi:MAG: hypothetical protein CL917_04750 [Deltaproteobacteria bacterium]|nr:hypothetical protein [Deltaproteobacteria bacterium]